MPAARHIAMEEKLWVLALEPSPTIKAPRADYNVAFGARKGEMEHGG
jgi:hypothetical protein